MTDSETPDEPTGDDDAAESSADVTIEVTEYDIDGDGVPDVVEMVTTTVIDVDGDGVPDVIDVIEVVGVDVNGDGVIDEDEIAVSETVYVREDDKSA